MKRDRSIRLIWWRPVALITAGGLITTGLLLHRLQSLAPRLSPNEQAVSAASASLHPLIASAADAPLLLLHWLAHFGPGRYALLLARLPSVLLALTAAGLFAYILRRWYGPRSMLFGMALFVTSAWFLHVGRFAGLDILYLAGPLALLAMHIALADHDDSTLFAYGWLLVNIVLLFTPGLIWFVLLSAFWQWRTLARVWRGIEPLWQRLSLGALLLAGLTLPAYDIIRTPRLSLTWLGLGALSDGPTPGTLLSQAGRTAGTIMYQGPYRPELWLGRLPILDLFVFAMFLAGVFFYARHWRASRTWLLASYLVLGIILASLNPIAMSVFVPVLYIVAVGGIAYVLHFWLKVFPRNPLARWFGIGLVTLVVALSCTYNLVQYFVAWPHNPEVHVIYHAK